MREMEIKVETFNCSLPDYAEDHIYLKRLKEILDCFPLKGPPYEATQICRHVYIGSQRNADDLRELKRLGITHVLNVAGTRRFDLRKSPYPKNSCIQGYLMIPAEDHEEYNIMQHFVAAVDFLDKVKKCGGKALVHCNLGINRSGATCCAYLMHDLNSPLLEVAKLLKMKRSLVLCNKGFRRQLIRYARVRSLLDPYTSRGVLGNGYRKADNVIQAIRQQGGYFDIPQHERNSNMEDAHHMQETIPPVTDDKYSKQEVQKQTLQVPKERRYRRVQSKPEDSISPEAYCTLPRKPKYKVQSSSAGLSKRQKCPEKGSPDFGLDTIHEENKKSCSSYKDKVYQYGSGDNDCYSIISRHGALIRPDIKKASITEPSSLSTSRPLRVYKRAATDTQLYQRPTAHTYRRSDTLATSSVNQAMDRLRLDGEHDRQDRAMSHGSKSLPLEQSMPPTNGASSPKLFQRFRLDSWKKLSRNSVRF